MPFFALSLKIVGPFAALSTTASTPRKGILEQLLELVIHGRSEESKYDEADELGEVDGRCRCRRVAIFDIVTAAVRRNQLRQNIGYCMEDYRLNDGSRHRRAHAGRETGREGGEGRGMVEYCLLFYIVLYKVWLRRLC